MANINVTKNGIQKSVNEIFTTKDGVQKRVTQMFTTVNGEHRPITLTAYDPVLDRNSWNQIAEASALGIASQLWKIGDIKYDTFQNFQMPYRIIGFDHDMYAPPSISTPATEPIGITFETAEAINSTVAFRTTAAFQGYVGGPLYSLMSTARSLMSQELRDNLKVPRKIVNTNSVNNTAYLEAPLWPLSNREVGLPYNSSRPDTGTTYEYYLPELNTTDPKRIKNLVLTTNPVPYWTRDQTAAANALVVSSQGLVSIGTVTNNYGVYAAVGFCI